jgi:hypothetical protein
MKKHCMVSTLHRKSNQVLRQLSKLMPELILPQTAGVAGSFVLPIPDGLQMVFSPRAVDPHKCLFVYDVAICYENNGWQKSIYVDNYHTFENTSIQLRASAVKDEYCNFLEFSFSS